MICPINGHRGVIMGAGRLDLVIEQGATFDKTVTWKDSSRAAKDLTAYTAAMQIRDTIDSTSTIASSTGGSPTITITLGGVAGTIQIVIAASVTADFTFDVAVYDLELTTGTTVKRLLEGEVKLSKEVTR
jgi:hypothetical protein